MPIIRDSRVAGKPSKNADAPLSRGWALGWGSGEERTYVLAGKDGGEDARATPVGNHHMDAGLGTGLGGAELRIHAPFGKAALGRPDEAV